MCCNSWTKPAPAFSAWRDSDVASAGGAFGFSELTFKSDTELDFRMWSATNRTILFEASVTFAPLP